MQNFRLRKQKQNKNHRSLTYRSSSTKSKQYGTILKQPASNPIINYQYYAKPLSPSRNIKKSDKIINKFQQKTKIKIQRQLIQKKQQLTNKTIQIKQYQNQLKQAYRVIHFYQGNVKQLQTIIDSYNNNQIDEHVKDIIKRNIQLSGKLEVANIEIQKLQKKLQQYQKKYQKIYRSIKLKQSSISQKSLINKQQNNQNQININSFNIRISQIQKSLKQFQISNQNLTKQLDLKVKQNKKLKSKIQQLKIRVKQLQQRQYINSKQSSTMTQSNSGIQLIKISDKMIRKLRYHLIKNSYPYNQILTVIQIAIQRLSTQKIQIQQLLKYPFNLSKDEAIQIKQYLNSLSPQKCQYIIAKKIPPYKPIDRDSLNSLIQIFFNRQHQIKNLISNHSANIQYAPAKQFFKKWGINKMLFDILGLIYYQQTGQLEFMNLGILLDYFKIYSKEILKK